MLLLGFQTGKVKKDGANKGKEYIILHLGCKAEKSEMVGAYGVVTKTEFIMTPDHMVLDVVSKNIGKEIELVKEDSFLGFPKVIGVKAV